MDRTRLYERLDREAEEERAIERRHRAFVATLPPSLAAIVEHDHAAAYSEMRGALWSEPEEPRYLIDVYRSRHPDSGGRFEPRWSWNPSEET